MAPRDRLAEQRRREEEERLQSQRLLAEQGARAREQQAQAAEQQARDLERTVQVRREEERRLADPATPDTDKPAIREALKRLRDDRRQADDDLRAARYRRDDPNVRRLLEAE
jgi:hypothetical protein